MCNRMIRCRGRLERRPLRTFISPRSDDICVIYNLQDLCNIHTFQPVYTVAVDTINDLDPSGMYMTSILLYMYVYISKHLYKISISWTRSYDYDSATVS